MDKTANDKDRPPEKLRYAIFAILTAVLVAVLLTSYWQEKVRILRGELMVAGATRTYRLALPLAEATRKRPVIFALHGALDTTDQMAESTGLDSFAASHDAIVVYLQGRLLNWPPSIPPENPSLAEPDYAFFRQMCGVVEAEYDGDPDRTYLVGVSQGAAMVNLMIANCSDLIDAAVCNCGWLPSPLDASQIETNNKCPILYVVGDQDLQVPEKAVRQGQEAFAAAGHPTRLELIFGHGHGWGREHGVNELMWEFLQRESTRQKHVEDN